MAARKKVNTGVSLDDLLKKYEGVLFKGDSEELAYERIPFNISALDSLIGGGIPKKKITLLKGQSNAGKTYLASQIVKSAQQMGGNAFWIDNEMSWDEGWMARCGVDIEKIHVAQPSTGESCFDLMVDIMKTEGTDLVVLDSIAGLVPTAVMEADEKFGYSPMAWQARFVNQSLPRIMPFLKNGVAIVLINQIRSTIGPSAPLSNLPGGQGQGFFSHLILHVRRESWITNKDNVKEGFNIEIKNDKTKSGGYSQRICLIPFKFEGGIDVLESEIRELIAHKIIKQSGAWYQLPDGEKVMGMGGLRTHFLKNDLLLENLMSGVVEKDEDDEIELLPFDEEEEVEVSDKFSHLDFLSALSQ